MGANLAVIVCLASAIGAPIALAMGVPLRGVIGALQIIWFLAAVYLQRDTLRMGIKEIYQGYREGKVRPKAGNLMMSGALVFTILYWVV